VQAGAQQITTTGGRFPVWSRDMKELYYWTESGGVVTIMAVPLIPGPSFNWGAATSAIRGRFPRPSDDNPYDVWNGRFVVLQEVEGTDTTRREIVVVQNWFEELKRRLKN
jgi:hypothetical protein